MSLTRQQVLQAVLNGLEVEVKQKYANLSYENINTGFYHALNPSSFDKFDWRIKPEEPKWYENIPEHGVLTWSNIKKLLHVMSFDPVNNTVTTTNGTQFLVSKVTPLTNDEIRQFLREE